MADTEKDVEVEETYSLEDLARRWECSQAYLKREIAVGLPMYQNKKGNWRIKESDVIDWEEKIEQAKEQKIIEDKKIKRGNMAAYIIGGIIVAIAGFIVLIMFTNI